MNVKSSKDEMNITINKVQLILAEKRTPLAVMRTGIAVFVLPLSVLSALVATSKFYDSTAGALCRYDYPGRLPGYSGHYPH